MRCGKLSMAPEALGNWMHTALDAFRRGTQCIIIIERLRGKRRWGGGRCLRWHVSKRSTTNSIVQQKWFVSGVLSFFHRLLRFQQRTFQELCMVAVKAVVVVVEHRFYFSLPSSAVHPCVCDVVSRSCMHFRTTCPLGTRPREHRSFCDFSFDVFAMPWRRSMGLLAGMRWEKYSPQV